MRRPSKGPRPLHLCRRCGRHAWRATKDRPELDPRERYCDEHRQLARALIAMKRRATILNRRVEAEIEAAVNADWLRAREGESKAAGWFLASRMRPATEAIGARRYVSVA